MAIEAPVKNIVEKFYFKISDNGKYNNSGVGSSTKSVTTCHKCGKKFHIKRKFISNRNGYDGELSDISTINLPKWVTKKPIISDVEYITTATMNHNKKQ